MANEQSPAAPSEVPQQKGPFDQYIQDATVPDDFGELQPALGGVEATVVEALVVVTLATTRNTRDVQARANTHRAVEAHSEVLADGSSFASLSLDIKNGKPGSIEAALDPFHGMSPLVHWLNEQQLVAGVKKKAIATRLGLSVSQITRIFGDQYGSLESDVIASTATIYASALDLSGDDRSRYVEDALGLHREYEESKAARKLSGPQPVVNYELPRPPASADELGPMVGIVGATAMEGLARLSLVALDREGGWQELANRVIKRHERDLNAYLSLAHTSLAVVLRQPGSVEAMLDPMYGLPEVVRHLRTEASRLGLSRREIARQLDIAEPTLSRLFNSDLKVISWRAVAKTVRLYARLDGVEDDEVERRLVNTRLLYDKYVKTGE